MKRSLKTLRMERLEDRVVFSASGFTPVYHTPSAPVTQAIIVEGGRGTANGIIVEGSRGTANGIIVEGSRGTANGIIAILVPGSTSAASGNPLANSPSVIKAFNPQPEPPSSLVH